MNVRFHLQLLVSIICFVGVLLIFYSNYLSQEGLSLFNFLQISGVIYKKVKETTPSGYVITNTQCKILNLNLSDKSIKKYISKPKALICSHKPLLTYTDQLENLTNVLKINKKNLGHYKVHSVRFFQCCYSLIFRIEQDTENYNSSADSLYELSNCTVFKNEAVLPDYAEFLLVKCVYRQSEKKKGKEIYKNVHPVVPILPSARKKMKKFMEKKNKTRNYFKEKLNVIILGIDSVSKLNLRRIMPKTLKYLKEKKWIELNGYNKVGENTLPNLMAILNGGFKENLYDFCLNNQSKKMDDCPMIWKDFDAHDYITLYAEDTPNISTFNFMRTGFVKKPTDYYMRPFMQAAHKILPLKMLNGLPVCLGPVIVVDHILNYAQKFFRAFTDFNHFSLLWLNSLSHNDVNAPSALDNSIYTFLNDISKIGVYDNSLILLLSDHGVRFGNIRETFLGYLEERLPFLFMWYPVWFRDKYREKYNNLIINQNRLTSPFDVHATLKKMLIEESETISSTEVKNENSKNSTKPIVPSCLKCTGLLEEVPFERTCSDANVDVNWCLCHEFRHLHVEEKTAYETGIHLYNYIVNHTKELIKKEKIKERLCAKWQFSKVFRCHEIIRKDLTNQYFTSDLDFTFISNIQNPINDFYERIFVIIIEVNPGKTKFESTLKMYSNSSAENPSFIFLEWPKRLDSIYKTSNCVNSSALKHYCYCVHR